MFYQFRFVSLVGLLTLLSSLASAEVGQIQSFNFDFDDNILSTGAQVMAWDVAQQKEIGISTADWALLKLQVPGQGLMLRADALRNFSDTTPAGEDLFKTQVEQALKSGNWKGPSWKFFVKAVSNPATRAYTTIITARLHSPDSIAKGLEVLAQTKDKSGRALLPATPDKEHIYPVLWPELPAKYRGDSPATDTSADRKSRVMAEILDGVEGVTLPNDANLIENREGTGTAPLHLWVFSDDDYNNIFTAFTYLTDKVKSGRWSHVKIMLLFTGLNNPAHTSHVPMVIKPDGSLREASAQEDPRQ